MATASRTRPCGMLRPRSPTQRGRRRSCASARENVHERGRRARRCRAPAVEAAASRAPRCCGLPAFRPPATTSCAASASVVFVTPGAGRKAARLAVAERDGAGLVEQQHVDVARRLPRRGPTSRSRWPASCGSCRRRRWRDSRPPMVVGIRHTSSATSAVTRHRAPRLRRFDAEQRVRQQRHGDDAGTRWSAPPAGWSARSRSGVFWRLAPSTIAIMRSRNASPGLAVTRTTIQSDSTLRAAGHRGEVAARLADHGRGFAGDGAFRPPRPRPSITSPSAGITSPASTSTTSPCGS